MNWGNVSVVATALSCSSLLPTRGRMAGLSQPRAIVCKIPCSRELRSDLCVRYAIRTWNRLRIKLATIAAYVNELSELAVACVGCGLGVELHYGVSRVYCQNLICMLTALWDVGTIFSINETGKVLLLRPRLPMDIAVLGTILIMGRFMPPRGTVADWFGRLWEEVQPIRTCVSTKCLLAFDCNLVFFKFYF